MSCINVPNLVACTQIVRHGKLEAPTACCGCSVKMSIEGWLPSGDIIEQSTIWFVVGYSEVIKGMHDHTVL